MTVLVEVRVQKFVIAGSRAMGARNSRRFAAWPNQESPAAGWPRLYDNTQPEPHEALPESELQRNSQKGKGRATNKHQSQS